MVDQLSKCPIFLTANRYYTCSDESCLILSMIMSKFASLTCKINAKIIDVEFFINQKKLTRFLYKFPNIVFDFSVFRTWQWADTEWSHLELPTTTNQNLTKVSAVCSIEYQACFWYEIKPQSRCKENHFYSLPFGQAEATILVKNLETLVSISPSPMLIWVSQWSQCFKIRVAQHWGGRRHISGGKTVWSRNLMIVPENSRETVSVSTICDEYCLCVWRAWTGNVNVARVIIVPCGGYVRSVLVLTFLDMK